MEIEREIRSEMRWELCSGCQMENEMCWELCSGCQMERKMYLGCQMENEMCWEDWKCSGSKTADRFWWELEIQMEIERETRSEKRWELCSGCQMEKEMCWELCSGCQMENEMCWELCSEYCWELL